jgi:hypothetical protein
LRTKWILFRFKRAEVPGGWRKLHNELLSLYPSPDTISVIKSRGIRWERHVAWMGKMRNAYKILIE